MITEEQLKHILNSLRLNVYDTPAYTIDSWCDKTRSGKDNYVSICIEAIEQKYRLEIYLYKYKSLWFFGREWFFKRKKPLAIVEKYKVRGNGTVDKIEISQDLYDDFSTFIKERNREEQFIAESNVNSEFNL